jgi:hypothetical protein
MGSQTVGNLPRELARRSLPEILKAVGEVFAKVVSRRRHSPPFREGAGEAKWEVGSRH